MRVTEICTTAGAGQWETPPPCRGSRQLEMDVAQDLPLPCQVAGGLGQTGGPDKAPGARAPLENVLGTLAARRLRLPFILGFPAQLPEERVCPFLQRARGRLRHLACHAASALAVAYGCKFLGQRQLGRQRIVVAIGCRG